MPKPDILSIRYVAPLQHCWNAAVMFRAQLVLLAIFSAWVFSSQFQELFAFLLEKAVALNQPHTMTYVYCLLIYMIAHIGITQFYWSSFLHSDRFTKYAYAAFWTLLSAAFVASFLCATLRVAIQSGWPGNSISELKAPTTSNVFIIILLIYGIYEIATHALDERKQMRAEWPITNAILGVIFIATALLMYAPVYQISLQMSEKFSFIPGYNVEAFQLAWTLTAVLWIIYLWMRLFALLSYLRIPAIESFVAVAVVFSLLSLNDNHEIRFSRGRTREWRVPIDAAFQNWLKSRPDLSVYQGNTYPVYIVASEGGGMYAAIHSAIVLARLQSQQPRFSQHVFALSTVSGGSFGTAVYRGLAQLLAKPCRQTRCDADPEASLRFEMATEQVLSEYYLTPVITRSLTSDLIQRVLPFPIPWADRSRGLEFAIEEAWGRMIESDTQLQLARIEDVMRGKEHFWSKGDFRAEVDVSWKPEDIAPAQIFNTTEVETGHRVVIAPFLLGDLPKRYGISNLRSINEDDPLINLSTSTAIGLIARFPYLTPAGYYGTRSTGGAETKHRLVDGGYYDNTGIETALDVIKSLERTVYEDELAKRYGLKGVRFILLSFSTKNGIARSSDTLPELVSPVRTMIASWRSRSEVTFRNAELQLNSNDPMTKLFHRRFRRFVMDAGNEELPLSWFLAGKTRRRIIHDLSARNACIEEPRTDREYSDCVFSSVVFELSYPQ
jgi:hypothetical protein